MTDATPPHSPPEAHCSASSHVPATHAANARETWLAPFVRRWHSNPYMAHVDDTVGAHSLRMIGLAYSFWPDLSRDLLLGIALHDFAESIVGDIPPAAKRMVPSFITAERLQAVLKGWYVDLTDEDADKLIFCDKLDAYAMVNLHAPRILDFPEWQAARRWIWQQAVAFGIEAETAEVIA